MGVIIWLVIIALLLYVAFWILMIILGCIAVGLVVGIFPAIFTSVKSYFVSINEEVTNPIIKWTLNICMGIGALVIAAPIVVLIIGIITSIV